jgi:hypothetical protein
MQFGGTRRTVRRATFGRRFRHFARVGIEYACMRNAQPHKFRAQDVVVRTLDVLATLGVLMLVAPSILLTVIAIKLEDGWCAPAFCTQRRVGLDGRTFDAIKFRTVRGPRLTRVGTVIRQHRIDHLPLLLNVLRGEVSLIMRKDRILRWAPTAWRGLFLAIIVALVLLGIVIGTR